MQQQIPSPPFPNPLNELTNPITPSDDPTSSSLFDWGDFLDFNLDETPFDHSEQPGFDTGQPADSPGRLRKRDPRLVCSNFLAGRIPCACPELDAQLEREESGLPGKKRPRTARNPGGAPARCQVPGCEVDISELKGYHKRHRVCLQCANASTVVLDGEIKRYCQQCGKFHILSDFDDDKRSCRRKLERHNNRRRRKANDSKDCPEKESQQTTLVDDLSGEDDAGKDEKCVTSHNEEREILLESDLQVITQQNLQSDSVISLTTSGETHTKGDKLNPELKRSPSYSENKSSYSSPCPAGRISFKLYDWNPAEFPRRLRLQIFQWLANMPVELEGYIRPGCTILTAFIAMTRPQWHKLMDEPSQCIKDLVASPGSLLSGRGTMHVYLNDMIFRVTKDATSVLTVKVNDQAPKLHYIFPNCFEAGRPMEFVACGTHLLQPNFRFLISISGRYLAYDIHISSLDCEKGDASSANHQLLKIYVPQIDLALSGPAFIEVENQSGLSNFIPILIGDKETCAEMEDLQQKIDSSLYSNGHKLSFSRPPCEVFASKQAEISELILDVAWLLNKPSSEQQLTSSQIQRSNCLLEYLIERDSSVILEKLVSSLRSAVDNNLATGSSDSETSSLLKNMDIADRRLAQKLIEKESSEFNGNYYNHNSRNDDKSLLPANNQGLQRIVKNILGLPSSDKDVTVPLLNGEVIMTVNLDENPRNSCKRSLTRTFFTSRPLIMAILAVCVCFGICAVVLHPNQIATTIHNCLFDRRAIPSFSP